MSNPTSLGKLSDEFMEVDEVMMASRHSSASKSRGKAKAKSASDSASASSAIESTRNELSEMLSKIRFTPVSPNESASASASKGSKSNTPEDVKEANRLLSRIQKETDRASNNILLYVKYLSSPLRLYLKTTLQMMPMDARIQHVNMIKINDRVKEDLVGEWTNKDTFGLKMLVKMYRLYQNVMPMLRDHDDFMRYFKPHHGKDAEARKEITYYMYNYIMNPGLGSHPTGQVSLEHDLHAYIDNFLHEEKDEIEAVGFDIKDFRDTLRNKLTFELNLYASIVFKKAVQFKYKPHGHKHKEEKLKPEEILTTLYQKFASFPGAEVFAHQMMHWSLTDDDMTNPARGYAGGKHKPKHVRVARKQKK